MLDIHFACLFKPTILKDDLIISEVGNVAPAITQSTSLFSNAAKP